MTATVSDQRAAGAPGPHPAAQASGRPGGQAQATPATSRCATSRSRSASSTSSATPCSASSSRGSGRSSRSLVGYTTELSLETIQRLGYQRQRRATGAAACAALYEFLLPAHITALAVNMLIYANNQHLAR